MKSEFKFGLLLAVSLFFWLRIELALGLQTTWLPLGRYTGYSILVLPPLLLFIALKQKKQAQAGKLAFLQGVMSGIISSAVAGITLVILFYFYSHYVKPGWITPIMDGLASKMQVAGWFDTDIANKQAELQLLGGNNELPQKGVFYMLGYGTGLSFLWALVLCKNTSTRTCKK